MSKEDIIKCFLDCKGEDNGFQLTLTNKDIDVIANEIKRLNNIINELEKEFDKELENLVYREEKLYTQGIHDTIINHKHLLQELKGSIKNDR